MNKPYESPYTAAMKGIRTKIAMQAIRKMIREDDTDENKLAGIIAVVHEYEDDQERAELEAERKAIEADEAEMQREKINEMFEDMAAPLDKLMDCVKGEKRDK